MIPWYHEKNKSSRYIMSYIIGMVSQKGGAGKSTLARLFARELAKDGFSVKIADLDTQQTTCTEWAADRAEARIEPEIQVQPFGNLKTALAEAGRFDAYILDGRPHSSQQTLEIAKAAHLTVIPTGQTKDDLRPAVKLAHSLADAGIRASQIAFALVKTTNSEAELNAARAYLEQTDYVTLDGFVPVSTAYGIAHDAGKVITETPHRTLNEKAERLAQSIINRLGAIASEKEAV
jgi:chromosome partitioning protein